MQAVILILVVLPRGIHKKAATGPANGFVSITNAKKVDWGLSVTGVGFNYVNINSLHEVRIQNKYFM